MTKKVEVIRGEIDVVEDNVLGTYEIAHFSLVSPTFAETYCVTFLPPYPSKPNLKGTFSHDSRRDFENFCQSLELPTSTFGSEREISFTNTKQLDSNGFPADFFKPEAPSPSATLAFKVTLDYIRLHSSALNLGGYYFVADNDELNRIYSRFTEKLAGRAYLDVECKQANVAGVRWEHYALKIKSTSD